MKQLLVSISRIFKINSSPRFKLGMILLLINPVIGLAVSPALVFLFSMLKDRKTGIMVGLGVYIFSWGLLGAGVIIAGRDGYRISKEIFREVKQFFFKKK